MVIAGFGCLKNNRFAWGNDTNLIWQRIKRSEMDEIFGKLQNSVA